MEDYQSLEEGTPSIGRLKPYILKARYYETDKMAVIHHSNYIRWFEEARVDMLEQIGLGYDKIEAAGIYSPVLGASCVYKSSVRFNETVLVIPKLVLFNGIKMTIEYRVLDAASGQIRATGETNHCFISTDFKPVSLKKSHFKMYELLLKWVGVETDIKLNAITIPKK
ncbi:MAG TPA: acyl-CoA thioesterase [Mobilitalea sp.]|nr:acyl-CoA thioesterase [Mobilitalea sp.]